MMPKDEFTLHDVSPRFQKRLLKWLIRHDARLTVRTTPDGAQFLVGSTVDEQVETAARLSVALERTLALAPREKKVPRSKAGMSPSFEKGVRRWLAEEDGVLSVSAAPVALAGESDKAFLVEVTAGGATGSGVDEDFEMALLAAEDLWEEQAPSARATVAAPLPLAVDEEVAPTTLRAPFAANRRRSGAAARDEEPEYVIQGLYIDGTVAETDGYGIRAVAVRKAAELARSPLFEGDYVRVITRACEPVWDSREQRPNGAPPPLPPLHGKRVSSGATIRRMVRREEALRRRDERPFDPEAPRERYAARHHFAVNHSRTAHADKDILREVVLGDTGYTLVTWDTGRVTGKKQQIIGYALYSPGSARPLFEAEDLNVGRYSSIDSDEMLRRVLTFLTLRPGDTDRDYFAGYSAEQLAFSRGEAEELQLYALSPEEGGPESPFVDVR